MKKLNLLGLSTAACLTASLLSGCGAASSTSTATPTPAVANTATAEASPTETDITAGVYEWENNASGMKTQYRFNEDGTYYGMFFGGGVTDAGTYEVLDTGMEYSADGGADKDFSTAEDNTLATSAQTVVLTSYLGGEALRMAYQDDALCDIPIGGGLATHATMVHNVAYAYDPAEDEASIAVKTLYANGESGSTLTLYHDKTYVDYTGDVGDEGTWEQDGDTYTLISADTAGQTKTLTVSADGTATYGDLPLASSLGDEIAYTFTAKDAQVGLPMGVDLTLNCYPDGSCKLMVYVAAVETELEADTGTYTVDPASFKISFVFDKAGEIAGEADFANATAEGLPTMVPYKADTEVSFMDAVTPLTIDCVLEGTV